MSKRWPTLELLRQADLNFWLELYYESILSMKIIEIQQYSYRYNFTPMLKTSHHRLFITGRRAWSALKTGLPKNCTQKYKTGS